MSIDFDSEDDKKAFPLVMKVLVCNDITFFFIHCANLFLQTEQNKMHMDKLEELSKLARAGVCKGVS